MALAAGAIVLGLAGGTGTGLADLTDPITAVTDQLEDATRTIAANTGRHLGFDTSKYPGDDAMQAWRDDGSYEWVGYYLQAPCHRNDSWSGKREALTANGWGLAVVYVGQQTWGRIPGKPDTVTKYVRRRVKTTVRRRGKRVTRYVTRRVPIRVVIPPRAESGSTCSTHYVSADRGLAEGDDAIARTEAEGFPHGTVIFLDIEHMADVPEAMREYYTAWTARVIQDGRYRPGFYAHTANASLIYNDVRAVYDSLGITDEPSFWVAGNTAEFAPGKAPTDVGHAFAAVWQGVLDRMEERNGHRFPIDVNVSAFRSPSSNE